MVQKSNVCIIKGLHIQQIFILQLFKVHSISVQDFVFIRIYFFSAPVIFFNLEECRDDLKCSEFGTSGNLTKLAISKMQKFE